MHVCLDKVFIHLVTRESHVILAHVIHMCYDTTYESDVIPV